VSHVITGFKATVDASAVLTAVPYVKIEDGTGNIVYEAHLTLHPDASSSGRGFYELEQKFDLPHRGTAGNAMIITLPAQGSGNVGKLSILGHWTEIA
jgi:hypothetical protein